MFLSTTTQSVEVQAKFFRGFGDPARLSILRALSERPMTVTELVTATELSQSNTSNHLRCLRDCGLVITQQQGKHVIYRLSDDRVAELLDLANFLLADVARGLYECTRYGDPILVGSELRLPEAQS